jgi:hypothetical protein
VKALDQLIVLTCEDERQPERFRSLSAGDCVTIVEMSTSSPGKKVAKVASPKIFIDNSGLSDIFDKDYHRRDYR